MTASPEVLRQPKSPQPACPVRPSDQVLLLHIVTCIAGDFCDSPAWSHTAKLLCHRLLYTVATTVSYRQSRRKPNSDVGGDGANRFSRRKSYLTLRYQSLPKDGLYCQEERDHLGPSSPIDPELRPFRTYIHRG